MSTVIKVNNLSKKYIIGHQRERRYTALRDVMMYKLRRMSEQFWHPLSLNREQANIEEFWALKDINFEVNKGERLGIIGRNGAGKSTLLKLLSRITEPSKGSISIKGRVSSLLEVGTGFHPELTGRENIYLNGAILGMGNNEIRSRFDEIVDFSGVENFLDTPVKRYSSGMQARLGFAVAAHLDPDILIVDEVLAVGDAEFQKKCLGKMENVSREEGRTVLFVSHNMAAVDSLTKRSVLLDNGELVANESTPEVIKIYLQGIRDKSPDIPVKDRLDRKGDGCARVIDLSVNDESGNINVLPLSPERKRFIITIDCRQEVFVTTVALAVLSAERQRIFWIDSSNMVKPFKLSSGRNQISLTLHDGISPSPGDYYLNVALIGAKGLIDYISDAHKFTITNGNFFGSGKLPGARPVLLVEHDWKIEQISHT